MASEGVSRFADDLPTVERFVSLGEGDTPVIELTALAERLGLSRLSAKMESQNPTGSYKDRIAVMSLSLALHHGNAGWIATSSGNAGLSMAAYGTRAGLAGFLCMVASAPQEKRLALLPYAVEVVSVDGVGREGTAQVATALMEQVRVAAEQQNLFLGITAHAFNPSGMRGVDTISYELAEQVPDASHVYVPTGGGGLLTGIARGLRHRGMTAKVVACQPAGCAPIVDFLNGNTDVSAISRCDSDISALQLPRPPDGTLAATAVETSAGWGTAPDDAAILDAQRLLAKTEGVFVEPASAASLAAVLNDLDRRRLQPTDHPVLVLTGAGWKDLARFEADDARVPLITVDDVVSRVDKWRSSL
ncbi:pyridoxal-phosphate dependent enzyme [Haloechinothrix halophila]|uniref:pyridoxal-phosphate dependent enzyme n=1 Tax=Haloechinothrix halophila TaxID=1069073 RepID=UPI00041599CE|nr:pyridoxal-phosphate dependent enzyme [Haloechinothrix halophila]